MSRLVLTIIALISAILVAGVLIWQGFFASSEKSSNGAPRIAIVTDAMLESLEQSQQRSQTGADRVDLWASSQIAAAQQVAAAGRDNKEPEPAGAPPAPQVLAPSAPNSIDISAMRQMLGDQLEALISQRLTESRRFAVMDISSVQATLTKFTTQLPQQAASNDAQKRSVIEKAAAGWASPNIAQPQAGKEKTAEESTQSIDAQIRNSDLAGAAAELNARYLLYVTLTEPRSTSKAELVIRDGQPELLVRFEADPIFIYRLFDVLEKRSVISGATRLDAPVAAELAVDLQAFVNNSLAQKNFETDFVRAVREVGAQLQVKIAADVARLALDATFPAQVRAIDPIVMNRGSNDGFAVGDEVAAFRVASGGQITDKGEGGRNIAIDQAEIEIGRARIIKVQSNTAELEPFRGAILAVNDRIRRNSSTTVTASTQTVPTGGLGKSDILANQANSSAGLDLIRERIAIGDIRQIKGDASQPSTPVPIDRALTERLAKEPRIEVMSREALAQLKKEQNVGGTRESFLQGRGAIGQAAYVLLGDVTLSSRRQATTLEVPGAPTREVSSSTSIAAAAAFRIERLDSRVIDSFQVTASVPGRVGSAEAGARLAIALADSAAAAILIKLFPIEIAQIEGKSVVLNRGADVGLKAGQVLTVFRVGSPIIDPTTKALISAGVRVPVGRVRIADVQETVSVAEAIGDGASFAVGHVVALGNSQEPTKARRSAKAASDTEKAIQDGATPW